MTRLKRVGILGAMHEEIAGVIGAMQRLPGYSCSRIGMRDYHVGDYYGQPCVVVLARIGKVAAAVTAVTLIQHFAVDELIFTGLAGALAARCRIGDIVIATMLAQHDLDARPFFPRHEVPLLGRVAFATEARLCSELEHAARHFLDSSANDPAMRQAATLHGIAAPALHHGLILSGDQFVADAAIATDLLARFPQALAVEMEGAAVAQVCHEHDVACAILRTVSDRADGNAHVDFGAFLASIASAYSEGILRQFFGERRAAAAQAATKS